MNKPTTTARIAAFLAAFGVTTLLVASQFGLASHYETGAGVWLAQGGMLHPVAQATTPAPRLPA